MSNINNYINNKKLIVTNTDINKWKKTIEDPPPSQFNYPKTNRTNQDEDLLNDYEYYEKTIIFIGLILFLNLFLIFIKNIKKILHIFICNLILIYIIIKLLQHHYKFDSKKKRTPNIP